MTISTIIVDDEKHCLDRLSRLLESQYSDIIHIDGRFDTFDSGLDGIHNLHPELVFLDVMIGEKTGFDLLRQLKQIDFDLIFTTAHEEYAVQAFRFSALDYLLKPIDPEDLKQAIARVQKKKDEGEVAEKIDALFHNLNQSQSGTRRLGIPSANGLTFVHVRDIVRCQSEVNYTIIHIRDRQKITVAKTLKEFEEMLSDCDFFRVHNSHLINLDYVKSYNRSNGGTVRLTDDSEIGIASRRKDDFLKRMMGR